MIPRVVPTGSAPTVASAVARIRSAAVGLLTILHLAGRWLIATLCFLAPRLRLRAVLAGLLLLLVLPQPLLTARYRLNGVAVEVDARASDIADGNALMLTVFAALLPLAAILKRLRPWWPLLAAGILVNLIGLAVAAYGQMTAAPAIALSPSLAWGLYALVALLLLIPAIDLNRERTL